MGESQFGLYTEVNDLLAGLKREFGDAVIGAGLYMSGTKGYAGLVGSVQTEWENEGAVVNLVMGRALTQDDSCGARSALRCEETILPSFMIKGHHCLNLPIAESGSALQIVSKDPDVFAGTRYNPNVLKLIDKLKDATLRLRRLKGPEVEDIMPVRENRPSHLLIEFDITGFSHLFAMRGQEKAFELRLELQKAIQDHVVQKTGQEGFFLDRDGGDAFWVSLDLEQIFASRTDYEQRFPDYLNNVVMPAIEQAIRDYNQRADMMGMNGRTPLKAVLSLGDLYTYHGTIGKPAPVYSGHPLVALEAYSIQADRSGSSITMADDVAQFIDQSQYPLVQADAIGKAALYAEKIASLCPVK